MKASDGKWRQTDVADAETLLRLIQSVPSPKAELVFTALAELSTRQIVETMKATGLVQNSTAGKKGERVAGNARLDLEAKIGKKVVARENYLVPVKKDYWEG